MSFLTRRAANVPIVVALNKVDLPDTERTARADRTVAQNVLAAEWGGDIEVVRTSGLTGAGLARICWTRC